MITDDDAYIRPCAAFPDGLEFDLAYVPILIQDGLIESAYPWAEGSTKNDYCAIYDENDMEYVADKIVRLVNSWR